MTDTQETPVIATETEVKLRAMDSIETAEIDAVVRQAGIALERLDATQHRDLYLDDATGSLRAAGIGLRLRRAAGTTSLCWKSAAEGEGPALRRTEMEVPWHGTGPPASAAELPLQLRDAVEPLTWLRPLQPLLDLQVHREHAVLHGHGHPIGELVIDQVAIVGTAAPTGFVEVEIEVQQELETCTELAKELALALPLEIVADSKLAHGSALAAGANAVETEPPAADAPFHEVLADRLTQRLQAMCREEIGVRQDSPGALHRMRVENRRLRALLRAFRNHWPQAEAEWLARELEATGRALGAVRDLEVMSAASSALADRVPEALRTQMPGLEQWLAGRRSAARDEMLAFLRDPARLATLQRLRDAFARAAPPAATPAPLALAAVSARIDKTARKMRRRRRALPDDLPQEQLHELRLIGKRLRYLAEEFAPWFADGLAPGLRALTRLQQVLGTVCDHFNAADVCVASIRTLGGSSRDPGAAAALLGGLATLHREAARREQKRAKRRLAELDRRRFWRAFSALAESGT